MHLNIFFPYYFSLHIYDQIFYSKYLSFFFKKCSKTWSSIIIFGKYNKHDLYFPYEINNLFLYIFCEFCSFVLLLWKVTSFRFKSPGCFIVIVSLNFSDRVCYWYNGLDFRLWFKIWVACVRLIIRSNTENSYLCESFRKVHFSRPNTLTFIHDYACFQTIKTISLQNLVWYPDLISFPFFFFFFCKNIKNRYV